MIGSVDGAGGGGDTCIVSVQLQKPRDKGIELFVGLWEYYVVSCGGSVCCNLQLCLGFHVFSYPES